MNCYQIIFIYQFFSMFYLIKMLLKWRGSKLGSIIVSKFKKIYFWSLIQRWRYDRFLVVEGCGFPNFTLLASGFLELCFRYIWLRLRFLRSALIVCYGIDIFIWFSLLFLLFLICIYRYSAYVSSSFKNYSSPLCTSV